MTLNPRQARCYLRGPSDALQAVDDAAERIEALEAALDKALNGLDSIAGDRTPEFFPETSYDCAKRVAKQVRELAALNQSMEEKDG